MDEKSFIVIGEQCEDVFVYGEAKRLSPEAPVPVFTPLYEIRNGGMAKNVYNNIFSLISLWGSGRSYGCFSNTPMIKKRFVEDKSNHAFLRVDTGDVVERITIDRSLKNILKNSDCVIISDYNKGYLTQEDIVEICENKKDGGVVFLDTKKKISTDVMMCVDFLKINAEEYENNKEICEEFKSKVIVTQGGSGAIYNGRSYPTSKKATIDVSGAGDTFMAALSYFFTMSDDMSYAIREANEAATDVVSRRGVSVVGDVSHISKNIKDNE